MSVAPLTRFTSVQKAPYIFLIVISCFDIARHRIPHLLLLLLLISYCASGIELKLDALLWLLPILSLCIYFTNVGMGDIKLLLLLGIFGGPSIFTFEYFVFAWVITAITFLMAMLFKVGMRGDIPLAPAISLPLVLIYLGF